MIKAHDLERLVGTDLTQEYIHTIRNWRNLWDSGTSLPTITSTRLITSPVPDRGSLSEAILVILLVNDSDIIDAELISRPNS